MNIFLRFSALPALLFVACAFAQTERSDTDSSVVPDTRQAVLPMLVSAPKFLRVGQPSEFTLEVVNNKWSKIQDCRPVLESESGGMSEAGPYGLELRWQAHNSRRLGSLDRPFSVDKGTVKRITLEVTPTRVPDMADDIELVFGLQCRLALTSGDFANCELEANQNMCLDIGMRDYAQDYDKKERPLDEEVIAEAVAEDEDDYGFTTAFSKARVTIQPEHLPFGLSLGSGNEDTIFVDTESREGFLDWTASLPANSLYDHIEFSFSEVPDGLGLRACSHLTGCELEPGEAGARLDKGTDASGWLTAFQLSDGPALFAGADDEYMARLSIHGYLEERGKTLIRELKIRIRALDKPLYCARLSDNLIRETGWAFFVEGQEDKPYIEGAYATDFLVEAEADVASAVMRHTEALTHRRSGAEVAGISGGLFQARVHPSASRFQLYMPSVSADGGMQPVFLGAEGNLRDRDGAWIDTLTVPVVQLDSNIRSGRQMYPDAYHDNFGVGSGPYVARQEASDSYSEGTLKLHRGDAYDCPQ